VPATEQEGTERPVGFGIVGCGRIGRWHATSLQAVAGAELVAVSDLERRAREEFASKFRSRAYDTAEALLRAQAVDVVSICTPPASHAHLIEAAALAGKHVLVEKPLALTLEEADRAVCACARQGVELGVAHQQRARSATMALRAMTAAGAFGEVRVAAAVHTWHRPLEQRARDGWRGQSGAGGDLLVDQAVHAIDLLVWFLGKPTWVTGATGEDADTDSAETVVATIGFESGALAALAASTAANRMRDDIALDLAGTRGGFRLEIRDYDHAEIAGLDLAAGAGRARRLAGTEVEALIRQQGGAWRAGPRSPLLRLLARIAGAERGGHPFRSLRAFLRRRLDRIAQSQTGELQGHALLLAGMVAAARGTGRPLVSGEEACEAIAVIDAIHRSQAGGGQRVGLARAALR
jgi:UDP-N-acetyl-2-amino-2-deoxyglucuronate dehydrogenase